MRVCRAPNVGTSLAEPVAMKRYLALLFGVLGSVACSKQPPPHTADDSSWVRVEPSQAQPDPEAKAATLRQSLTEQPSPWAPPKTSEAVAPTSMTKPPPATEAPLASSPDVPNAMPQPDPL
jgi:hypothetical protein